MHKKREYRTKGENDDQKRMKRRTKKTKMGAKKEMKRDKNKSNIRRERKDEQNQIKKRQNRSEGNKEKNGWNTGTKRDRKFKKEKNTNKMEN